MILLKRLYIMNWLSKSVILILKESTKRLVSKRTIRFRKKNHKTMVEDVDEKISDISKSIDTQDFNQLAKIIFGARIVEASKSIATETQLEEIE